MLRGTAKEVAPALRTSSDGTSASAAREHSDVLHD
jgi:hypothetical protein